MENIDKKKDRSTVYVTPQKVKLAKSRGYSLSQITEDALDIVLDINDNDELEIQNKITIIDEQIIKLNFNRRFLIERLNKLKTQKIKHENDLEKQKAFNQTVKELKENMDIELENLEKNAYIIGITPEELYDRAKDKMDW